MQDEEKTIDVGEADEQETTIDLDAPAAAPIEEEIQVEETIEDVKEEETPDKPKDELGEYSEGVQKRIAKLTRKMREAERQKEEAIQYAKSIQEKTDSLKNKYEKLDSDYTQEFEKRVTTNIDAVKQKLAIAMKISHRVYVMGHGQIVFEGTPAELDKRDDIRKEWLEV